MLIVDRANPEDAEEILLVQKLAFQRIATRLRKPELPPLTESLDELLADFGSCIIAQARWAEQLIGSVRGYAIDDVCEIRRMSVHPQFNGKGIGAALLVDIEKRFPSADRFELYTSTENVEAIRLYERHGYAITHTQETQASGTLVFLAKLRHAVA